jgi:hypothetical protein
MYHGENEIVSAQSHTIASEALFTGNPNFFREEKSYQAVRSRPKPPGVEQYDGDRSQVPAWEAI